LRFIGFQVPRKFLEQTFLETYGFDVREVLGRAHPALRSHSTSVRSFIPAFAEAEMVLHRRQFPLHPADEAYRTFAARVSRTNYERRWKAAYRWPGFKAHMLAFLVFIVPKIGPAEDLAIKIPSTDTEEWYLRSVNHTVDSFRAVLDKLRTDGNVPLALANLDLDTGNPVRLGDYPLADKTYAGLLARLTSKPGRTVSENVKQNIIEYYAASGITIDPGPQVNAQLELLKGMKSAEANLDRTGSSLFH
jgi:hypothetical protein